MISVSRKQLMAVRSAAAILVLTVKSHIYTYFVIYVAYSFMFCNVFYALYGFECFPSLNYFVLDGHI